MKVDRNDGMASYHLLLLLHSYDVGPAGQASPDGTSAVSPTSCGAADGAEVSSTETRIDSADPMGGSCTLGALPASLARRKPGPTTAAASVRLEPRWSRQACGHQPLHDDAKAPGISRAVCKDCSDTMDLTSSADGT